MSVKVNDLPCDVCGGAVKHLDNCQTMSKTTYETAIILDALEFLRDKCHQNSINKGFWDEDKRTYTVEGCNGLEEVVVVTKPWNFGEKIALIHSELSEMFEAWRKNQHFSDKDINIVDPRFKPLPGQIQDGTRRMTAIEEEMADVIIRVLDLCGKLDIDVGRVVLAKMQYNEARPHMHGGRKC